MADLIISGMSLTGGGMTITLPPTSSVIADTYFKYTTILLSGDGTNNATNATFVDSSTNNFTITRNGNTTQGTFSPYGANWSNYFNGTGDYLSVPSSAALNLTGDFTLETWIYPTTINSYNMILGSSGTVNPDYFTIRASSIELGITTNNNYPVWNYSFVTNSWYYVVISRASGALKAFVNGQQLTLSSGSANDSSQIFPSGFANFIGRYAVTAVPHYFTGYISNLRVVKGTAVYTANFTPSTTPLTAIANTSLLTCQSNRFIDNSTNNFTITKNGDTSVQRFSPFSPGATYSTSTIGGSAYFDGTGDFLSAPNNSALDLGSGDYTIEGWWYFTDTSNQALISKYTACNGYVVQYQANNLRMVLGLGSSDAVYSFAWTAIPNTWNHVAITRSGTSGRAFINGVQIGSTTTFTTSNTIGATTLQIGSTHTVSELTRGYVTDVRIVKGTAVYTSTFTPPTAPLTAISGTSLLTNFTNAGIYDASMMNNLETVGDAKISTAQTKFGSGSMSFDGTGDYLYSAANINTNLSGVYTAECWIYSTSLSSDIVVWFNGSFGNDDNRIQLAVRTTGRIDVYSVNTGVQNYNVQSSTGVISANTWYHTAVVSNGTTVILYVNGSSVASSSITGTPPTVNTFYVGYGRASAANVFYTGYIDDLRITKGYARYTANFTPPTAALPTQ